MVIVIFGGTKGIGLEIAKTLIKVPNYKIVILGRDFSGGNLPEGIYAAPCDLNDTTNIVKIIYEISAALGPIDVLITNQGGPKKSTAKDITNEELIETFTNIVISAKTGVDCVLQGMIEKKFGRIIMISSTSAKEPMENMVISNVTRSALHAYAKTLSREVFDYGITVNCIMPGPTNTERLKSLGLDIPPNKIAEPSGIASLVEYLCSDNAKYMTGQMLAVDCGSMRSL